MRAAILLAMTTATWACGPGDVALVETTDSAGITLVWNRGPDRPLPWTFEPILTLGGEEDGPEAFFQIRPTSIGSDAAGNVVILDRGNFRVVVFDAGGRHLRTMGRQGGGPGEFQIPTQLIAGPDGDVAVADIGHGGLVRFGPDGTPQERLAIEHWVGGRVAHTGDALVLQVAVTASDTSYERIIRLPAGDHPPLVSWLRPPYQPVDLGCIQLSGMPQVFAPRLVWTVGPGFVAVAGGTDYTLDQYDSTGLLRRVRRDLAPRATTRAMALQEIGDNYRVLFGGGGGCSAPAERVVDAMGVAPFVQAIGALTVAPDGAIWAHRRGVRGESPPIDVFAPSGAYLGTLPPGSPFPAGFRADGTVLVVEEDDLEIQRVVVYRIGTPS